MSVAPSNPAPKIWSLSFLVSVLIGVVPALIVAGLPGDKNEAYEWTQHRVAGLMFGGVFAAIFFWGCWRPGRMATAGGLLALVTVSVVIWRQGLPGFHLLQVIGGILVAAGFHFSTRREPPAVLATLAVAFCATLGFWAVARLSWWMPFPDLMKTWGNRAWFAGITVSLVGCLCVWSNGPGRARAGWLVRLIDLAVLVALAAAVARTTYLEGNGLFVHHWSVFAAPAEMVREGRVLLGEVPSQYGFLLTLLLAWWPAANCFDSLFWVQTMTVWVSGVIIYGVLRSWLATWWWQLGAGLITISCVAFFCGDTSQQTGPIVYPSVGAVRFIWVHVLLGYLFWWQCRAQPEASTRTPLWVGSLIWLFGVIWAVESAAYVTAVWLPAATLLAMPSAGPDPSRLARLLAFLRGIGRALACTGALLAGALLLITVCYRLFYSRTPEWSAYWDYAKAFSGGFMALPIEPQGGVWVLLLLHVALVAVLSSLDAFRQRALLVLTWAAWGAFWGVSTYYISRSHLNNIANISPVLLLVVGLLVHVARAGNCGGLVRPWVWISVPPLVGATLWLVVTNPAATRRQLADFFVQPRVSKLLPSVEPALTQLLAQCQQAKPGAYSVIGPNAGVILTQEIVARHENWLPLRSLVLYGPLPHEQRARYLDAYHHKPVAGWLLVPVQRDQGDLWWVFNYIEPRFTLQMTLNHEGWEARYYVARVDQPR